MPKISLQTGAQGDSRLWACIGLQVLPPSYILWLWHCAGAKGSQNPEILKIGQNRSKVGPERVRGKRRSQKYRKTCILDLFLTYFTPNSPDLLLRYFWLVSGFRALQHVRLFHIPMDFLTSGFRSRKLSCPGLVHHKKSSLPLRLGDLSTLKSSFPGFVDFDFCTGRTVLPV